MTHSEITRKYFLARRTIIEIMEDRGYTNKDDENDLSKLQISEDHFNLENSFLNSNIHITNIYDLDGKPVVVLFVSPDIGFTKIDELFGKNMVMHKIIKLLGVKIEVKNKKEDRKAVINKVLKIAHPIIIYMPSEKGQKYKLEHEYNYHVTSEGRKRYIEIFRVNQLVSNITDHIMFPPHSKITDDEKTKVINDYQIKNKKMPTMQLNGPVSRYYDANNGDIFRIIRKNKEIYYRLVSGFKSTKSDGSV